MSPEAALRSDHVNLLIHRYLQESGFENAARALHVDWQRHANYRDPESLPFAHTLRRNELISVIQAGLHYDDLRARASKTDHKFQWMSTRERTDGYAENGAGTRPSSSGRRKGHAPVRAGDDFPTPMPKRQRRSEGSDTHVNGERGVADVDAVDAEADEDAEGEEDVDVASPAGLSEPEVVPAERYDSVMTQTEFRSVPKTASCSWTIEKPGARLLLGLWNLGPQHRHARTLLAVGDSLCRQYEIPEHMEDSLQVDSVDEPILSDGSAITAAAWRPDGEAASYAIDMSTESAEQSRARPSSLVERNRDGSSAVFFLTPPKFEPAGIVITLRYSPTGEYLLAARTNAKRGLVQIWRTARLEGSEEQTVHEPIAWRMFENPINDVSWAGHHTFVACGEAGFSFLYQIEDSQQQASETQIPGGVAMHGLISVNSSILSAKHAWDHVRIDQQSKITTFASIDAKRLVLTPRIHSPDLAIEKDFTIDLAGDLAALEFQPGQNAVHDDHGDANTQTPSLLAVALDEGTCCIYTTTRQTDGTITATAGPLLSLAEGPISAIAWSARGDYLAVGNADLVQIWRTNSLKRTDRAGSFSPEAYATWKPAMEASRVNDEQHDEEIVAYQPSLSWSSDDTLAYAADKQIAIMSFNVRQPETNGQGSPQR